jgi:hypothetical protein
MTTVDLVVEVKNGVPVLENVLVDRIADNRFRLLRSPGLVPGMAAGDEFELVDGERHGYRLLKRGGNISVQMFFPHDARPCRDTLVPLAEQIGGRLDGEAATSNSSMLVLTLPASAGFPAIEQLMEKAKSMSPRCEWFYGNVYDLDDGVTPLNWWSE